MCGSNSCEPELEEEQTLEGEDLEDFEEEDE